MARISLKPAVALLLGCEIAGLQLLDAPFPPESIISSSGLVSGMPPGAQLPPTPVGAVPNPALTRDGGSLPMNATESSTAHIGALPSAESDHTDDSHRSEERAERREKKRSEKKSDEDSDASKKRGVKSDTHSADHKEKHASKPHGTAKRESKTKGSDGSMLSEMKAEKSALRSLSTAADQYKAAQKATQQLVKKRDAETRHQEKLDKKVADAVAKLSAAKTKRLDADKKDMQTDPLSTAKSSTHSSLAGAEATVSDAEKELASAQKEAASAQAILKKAEDKADQALKKEVDLKARVTAASREAESVGKEVKRMQERKRREDEKQAQAAAALDKQRAALKAVLETASK